mmetsp:Transcript_38755/g.101287  ORF Transcript_38755/g.101287 Transcript_38755/m.101287 type:complete len:157 (+) Transcript_38755:30-500(+)
MGCFPSKNAAIQNTGLDGLGMVLETKKGVTPAAQVFADKKAVMLYFAAHWCPSCRAFTPVLVKMYEEHMTESVAVVFVSSDRTDQTFKESYEDMPWAALPFEDRARKDALATEYGVAGIPSLIVLDGSGKLLSREGRQELLQSGSFQAALESWQDS